ncbi:MAG: hypothetical protein KKH17_05595 [Proteobacteria bacterium]|nr:hypothetical protein [Pseudomonadota bacterium]
MLRNWWPESSGMGGRFVPELVAGMERNTHPPASHSGVTEPFDLCYTSNIQPYSQTVAILI